MKTIVLSKRSCDYCGESELEDIYSYSSKSRTRNHTFLWKVRNMVCKKCGFAFVSPAPTEKSLEEYYGDSFSYYSGQSIDYSIKKRLHIIKKYLNKTGKTRDRSYIEIGSNDSSQFLASLSGYFENIKTVELNKSVKSTYSSIKQLPDRCGDIIAAYDVLHHVPKPRDFLASCASALRGNGFLILEVPNLYHYPKDCCWLSTCEIVNHFSPHSLSRLADVCGLKLVDLSYKYASRVGDFVGVFKNDGNIKKLANSDTIEQINARTCLVEGMENIKQFQHRLKQVRHRIDVIGKKNRTVVIWAANKLSQMLVEQYQIPKGVVIVDSDPRKKNYLQPLSIYQPKQVLGHIKRAELFVLNTRIHIEEIKDWIEQNTSRTLKNEDFLVLS